MAERSFSILGLIVLINFFVCAQSQGDSLRSALNAINKRQRDLSDYNDNEYGFTLEKPDDVAFLQSPEFRPGHFYDPPIPQGGFLEDDRYDPSTNKRLSSAFRERMEEDNEKQVLKERAQNLISNMERKGKFAYENEDYEDLLRELWDKYRRPYERDQTYPDKRVVYQTVGFNTGSDKKQSSMYNGRNPYAYVSEDEQIDDDEDDSYPSKRLKSMHHQNPYKRKANRGMQVYSYNPYKQFQVRKRSSTYPGSAMVHQHKRSAIKRQTDPKVEKELSNIFGAKSTESAKDATTAKPLIEKQNSTDTTHNKTSMRTSSAAISSTPMSLSDKPLQIEKKSVDWSDYFGIDRKKKSDSDDLDKEWLIENYHKSISMSNKKRNSGQAAPEPCKREENYGDEDHNSNEKIDDIDDKLEIMEDNIVDEALKYTGANEGESNPKKLKKIKDRVLSQLAAAYSLEKMRKALGEYKTLMLDENDAKKPQPDEDYSLTDEKFAEKRSAIPRKQVVDKDRENSEDADNGVKCAKGEEDCFEQNYKTPSDVVESYLGTEECPVIDRACSDVTSVIGQYGKLFKTACTMYQMCLLCNNNSWFPPTRQCNSLFIGKAYDLCRGNIPCQRDAQRAIRYLLDVNRSLHAQSQAINNCELSCPDSDAVFDPNYR